MYSVPQLQSLLVQAGWPDITVTTRDGPAPLIALMASVAMAESGGNAGIENCSTGRECSIGLLQINVGHPGGSRYGYSIAQLKDPIVNLQVALRIFNEGGGGGQAILRNWGAFFDGSYLDRGQYNSSLAAYGAPPITSSPEVTVAAIPDTSGDAYSSLPVPDAGVFFNNSSSIGIGGVAAIALVGLIAIWWLDL
jgi:Lysozyme like domain